MRYVRDLKQVRGLGLARGSVRHWLTIRASQVALLFLGSWLFYSLYHLWNQPYILIVLWLSHLHNFILLSLIIVIGFLHAESFLRIIFEDYVHTTAWKIISYSIVKALVWLCIVFSISVLLVFVRVG